MAVEIQRYIADTGNDTASGNVGLVFGLRCFVLPVLILTACGFPRPRDIGDDDAPGDSGTPVDPATIVHVSPSGDDANDGHVQPVKTIKHALELAIGDTKVTQITLTAGAYSMLTGETFPYTLPANIALVGPSNGGAVLLGTKSEVGITVADGELQNIVLQDFATAIIATGMTHLKNIQVLTSTVAVQAKNTANATINNLDITGVTGTCAQGFVLTEAAQANIDTLTARNLGVFLDSKDQSSIDLTNANLSGDTTCPMDMLQAESAGRFIVRDSVLDGGPAGISLNPKSAAFQATISNTIIRNMKSGGIDGGFSGPPASVQWIGGEISNNGGTAIQIDTTTWTFTNVKIQNNQNLAIYQQGGTLNMRGCTITDNGQGVDAYLAAHTDLGTSASPGNNIIQGNKTVGVFAETAFAVTAVGNTWNANVQETDATGKYATVKTLNQPVAATNGNNFAIASSSVLTR
jgi:hypothetical protein